MIRGPAVGSGSKGGCFGQRSKFGRLFRHKAQEEDKFRATQPKAASTCVIHGQSGRTAQLN
eukprot:2156914-Rhodomonas_salina.1